MSVTPSTVALQVTALRHGRSFAWPETVVGEEPLEIRLAVPGRPPAPLAVTMRTPGHDFELAVGFLRSEGILRRASALRSVRYCVEDGEQHHNIVTVDLDEPVELAPRPFTVSASCGLCGSSSIEALADRCPALPPGPQLEPGTLLGLPDELRAAQQLFDATGGVHAAGLFDAAGRRLVVREDVGRHNAVDKLLGWQWLDGSQEPAPRRPAGGGEPARGTDPGRGTSPARRGEPARGADRDHLAEPAVLVVSGRVSFEIVQKAGVGRLAFIVAVSAPSSLAVETARRLGITLVAFARGDRANVYSGAERLASG